MMGMPVSLLNILVISGDERYVWLAGVEMGDIYAENLFLLVDAIGIRVPRSVSKPVKQRLVAPVSRKEDAVACSYCFT